MEPPSIRQSAVSAGLSGAAYSLGAARLLHMFIKKIIDHLVIFIALEIAVALIGHRDMPRIGQSFAEAY